jgi:hypothetical protein
MKNTLLVVCRTARRALRRTALVLGLGAAVLGSLAVTTPAHASDSQFMGWWFNVNPSTNDLVRITIGGSPGNVVVDPFGACSPSACEWGWQPMTTYGNNVSDADHHFGSAAYDQGFARRIMTFHLLSPTLMCVDTYSLFTDGSGRQNYHTHELFHKVIIIF